MTHYHKLYPWILALCLLMLLAASPALAQDGQDKNAPADKAKPGNADLKDSAAVHASASPDREGSPDATPAASANAVQPETAGKKKKWFWFGGSQEKSNQEKKAKAKPVTEPAKDSAALAAPEAGDVVMEQAKPAPASAPSSAPAKVAKTRPPREDQAFADSGMVWVNVESGAYYKGGDLYGNTPNGKFMTEDEALKQGYHEAKKQGKKK